MDLDWDRLVLIMTGAVDHGLGVGGDVGVTCELRSSASVSAGLGARQRGLTRDMRAVHTELRIARWGSRIFSRLMPAQFATV